MMDASTASQSRADEIRAAVAGHRAVLFCGAGISVDPPATLPDWKTLRDETIKAVASIEGSLSEFLPNLINQELIGQSGHALAPELVATHVRAVVPDYFQSLRILDHDQPNDNHALIARLASAHLVKHIVTTNFDQLIEKALTGAGIDVRIYRSDDDFASASYKSSDSGSVELFKLHGCISEPDTIVATVEQEAVGLSPQKAAVLRWLWKEFTAVFWGYSGADLKLELDYLQMVSSAPSAKGFFWTLFSTPTWREEPNEFVKRLVELYAGRGVVCHDALRDVLGPLVGHKPLPQPSHQQALDLRRKRNAELTESLQRWARRSVQPQHALEIFARLHEDVNDLQTSGICYQRLGDLGFTENRFAVEALGYARGCEILSRRGQLETLEDALMYADDRARTAGALDLDLIVARTRADFDAMCGHVLRSFQPRSFARLLTRWATPAITVDALSVELDIADHLVAQHLFEPALDVFQAAERKARQTGHLIQVADALARRSRVHELRGELSTAVACVREAREILRVLGLVADARLLELRLRMLEPRPGEQWDAMTAAGELLAAADQARNQRLLCEIILEIAECTDIAPQHLLDLVSRVGDYVDQGGHHLKVRLAVQRSRAYRRLEQTESELETISDVLPLLDRVGNERAAVELYGRLASLTTKTGGSKETILNNLEKAAGISRKANAMSSEVEDSLSSLRQEIGRARSFPDYESFVAEWSQHLPNLPDLLDLLARSAGMTDDEKDRGRAYENRFGVAGRFIWMLWTSAVLCRQLREEGQEMAALQIAKGSLPMAAALGDSQLTALLHNECGQNLLKLQRPDLAFKEFTEAIHAAEAAADRAEIVDNLLNAAAACEMEKRFDLAIEFYRRAQAETIVRQDLVAAADVSTYSGEALKALGRDKEACGHFEAAEYLSRALGDWRKIEQSMLRLGKIYWNLGEYHKSIHYRHELVEAYTLLDNARAAALFAFLVANTYDEKLDRPRDAATYYRRAMMLNDETKNLNKVEIEQRLQGCEARMVNVAAAKGLWELLIDAADSEPAAERMAARLALAVDFNLWRFDGRSFAAWYEQIFPAAVSYPAPGDQALPFWPFAATYQLVEIGRSARELHRHEEALSCFTMADRVASAFGIAQSSYIAVNETAKTQWQLGADEIAKQSEERAAEIKQEFAAQAAARGLEARSLGEKTLTPWGLIGAILALQAHNIPTVSIRHSLVKHRLVDEFFMGE